MERSKEKIHPLPGSKKKIKLSLISKCLNCIFSTQEQVVEWRKYLRKFKWQGSFRPLFTLSEKVKNILLFDQLPGSLEKWKYQRRIQTLR